MPQKSLWHGFEPMPLASEASLAGCDQFRPRHQPLIHDGGRRCGDARFGNDTTSAICSGCEPDGRLRISEAEVRARCAADARCVGYGHLHDKHGGYYRPHSAWGVGARFSTAGKWRVFEKACATLATTPVSELAARFPPPRWPALVISSKPERFVRVKAAVEALGFEAAQLPAVFPPQPSDPSERRDEWRRVADGCQPTGNNGVRAAHRAAWRRISAANVSMAVFEEDAVPMPGVAVSVDDVRAFLTIASDGGYDMAFLNEVCPNANSPYLSNAAQWITPRAARRFLRQTSPCFPSRGEMMDIDHWTSRACFAGLRCLEAPAVNGQSGGFGCGLFAQDRKGVEPWRGFGYVGR